MPIIRGPDTEEIEEIQNRMKLDVVEFSITYTPEEPIELSYTTEEQVQFRGRSSRPVWGESSISSPDNQTLKNYD